jgi:hypothetical protein
VPFVLPRWPAVAEPRALVRYSEIGQPQQRATELRTHALWSISVSKPRRLFEDGYFAAMEVSDHGGFQCALPIPLKLLVDSLSAVSQGCGGQSFDQ